MYILPFGVGAVSVDMYGDVFATFSLWGQKVTHIKILSSLLGLDVYVYSN